jgi:signal transduction histidine kinase
MTILIVDDNESNLYQLEVLLGGSGYQIVTAANGAEALTKARKNPPDLVISDILMPVMDGFTLCRKWKKDERLRKIPFVFYTATYTDDRDREFALSLGAERFLVKPEEPEVFIRTIREVIQQVQLQPARPSPPAAKAPARLPVEEPAKEEFGFLSQYNEVLIRKLEAKMQQLEEANRELERDITEREEAEAEHIRLEQQLIQAQKMEAVGRLAGGVAHDFNNLLTIINGFAALLTQRTSPEDPRRAWLQEILLAGERAASLTRQLLAFGHRQVLDPRVLNLNSVLADIENMLRRLIGEDVELVTTLQPELGRVKVDAGQIEQVIMNLAVNARDAMPEGGKLLIETSNVEIDEDYARSHANMTPGKYVMVAVSDTGCGMDLDTQAHLFEPFFTTKEEGRGTGLGLATVYGIVEQSGGFIWVYSEPGRGSTFKIYFPRVEEDVPTAEMAEVPAEPGTGTETVLVVEDEGGVRSLVCETLASYGYKVLEAAGAAQALQIAEQHTEPIHLLLTDVVMPQTGGKELVKQLCTLHPEAKVLYMSGYTDDAMVRRGILEGGMPFLQKPFAATALLVKISEVLGVKPGTQP